jgi:signal transduction histidine kinase/ligand-binding sensor domain-containing protein
MVAGRIACWVMLLCICLQAGAAGTSDDLSFERRRWTRADGAPAQPDDVTQTNDGLLWFASPTGLYSFDGLTFRRETQVYGHAIISSNTLSVRALPDGGLAVGYKFGGVSLFSPKGARHFRPGHEFPPGSTAQIIQDRHGVLYAYTSTAVAALRGGEWQVVGDGSFQPRPPFALVFDKSGTLWAQAGSGLFAFDQVTNKFHRKATLAASTLVSTFAGKVRARLASGPMAELDASGAINVLSLNEAGRYGGVVQGPGGSVLGMRDGGTARLARGADGRWRELEFYPSLQDLWRQNAYPLPFTLFQDREGNLWQSTSDGVQRMRQHRFHQFKSKDLVWFVQRGLDDEMWMGGAFDTMRRMKSDGTVQATDISGPNTSLRLGPDRLWLGTETELWEFAEGKRRRWDLPKRKTPLGIQALARDADGALLVSLVRSGLWRFSGGVWTKDGRTEDLTDGAPICMLTDTAGRTWLGFTDNRLGLLTPTGLEMVSERLKLRIGNIFSMVETGGRLLIGGDGGVAWVTPDALHMMQFRRGSNVQRVTGMVQDKLGRLWLHGDDGLHVVPASALAQFWRDPAVTLEPELFNFEDGIVGAAAPTRPLPSLALGPEGRLYYATGIQVGWVDPADIRRNPRAPDVLIRSLSTPDQQFNPLNGVQLPQLTTTVDIGFTATALSIPERVRMKYRLEGVDRDWREVGQERAAHYTNLAPGSYRFQVIAANEDGVWNLKGAELLFGIEPAVWQTWWFRLLCALLLALGGWSLYRWRVSVLRARAISYAGGQWQATVEERGRIARSLHDNLLQAVQALMMQFHLVQLKMTREPELQSKIEAVLDYAEQLVRDTRDQVMDLRNAHPEDDWTMELRRAIVGIVPDVAPKLEFVVAGDARLVTPKIIEEISCVVREAVLNSARHADASQIRVQLDFGPRIVTGEVIDDGVGIDDDFAGQGKSGHFGIVGMRERLKRIGGRIGIRRKDEQGGTVVAFTIPVAQAYDSQE